MDKFECSGCGFSGIFTRVQRPESSSKLRFYLDHEGRLVYGKKCHACRLAYRRKSRGQVPKFDLKNCSVAKGASSEKIAAERFKKLGFSVLLNDRPRGPDLTCSIGKLRWTVEVKTAVLSGNRSSYFVHGVHEKRRKDDLVALVLPSGRVHIDSMESHLKQCNSTGCRTITAIAREA